MSAPRVQVPGMSREEKALMSEQTALLRQQSQIVTSQMAQQKALLPFFAQQAGLELDFNDAGEIIGAHEADDPLRDQDRLIRQKFNERSLAALEGNLPVDPALEAGLEEQEMTLRERLHQQLGPGWENSTPGIEALEKFRSTAEQLRFGARTGMLTLAEQLGFARGEMGMAGQAQGLGIFRQSAIGDPMAAFTGSGQVAAGFQGPISNFQRQRSMQFQGNMFNAQSQTSNMAGWGQLAGTLFGAVAGGSMGSMIGSRLFGGGSRPAPAMGWVM